MTQSLGVHLVEQVPGGTPWELHDMVDIMRPLWCTQWGLVDEHAKVPMVPFVMGALRG